MKLNIAQIATVIGYGLDWEPDTSNCLNTTAHIGACLLSNSVNPSISVPTGDVYQMIHDNPGLGILTQRLTAYMNPKPAYNPSKVADAARVRGSKKTKKEKLSDLMNAYLVQEDYVNAAKVRNQLYALK